MRPSYGLGHIYFMTTEGLPGIACIFSKATPQTYAAGDPSKEMSGHLMRGFKPSSVAPNELERFILGDAHLQASHSRNVTIYDRSDSAVTL